MKLKGSDSSRRSWFDGLSTHFSWDYPPVTGMLSRTLHNADNIIRFLFWILAAPSEIKPNTLHCYLALRLCLQCTCQTELRPRYAALHRTGGSWASHCLPVWIPTNCTLFMLIYYTFSPLVKSPWISKYYSIFSLSLSLSASFPPLPLHLFSPVAFDQTEEKAAKTNTHSVSPA